MNPFNYIPIHQVKNKPVIRHKIDLRPSSINDWMNCRQKWFQRFVVPALEGQADHKESSHAKAARGTAIHYGAEAFWTECMALGEKIEDYDRFVKMAVMSFEDLMFKSEESGYPLLFNNITPEECLRNVESGMIAFFRDIVPKVEIPEKIEHTMSIEIDNHPIIARIRGTADYIGHGLIYDIKTSTRSMFTSNHTSQQSTYKWLAEHNGFTIDAVKIQNITIKDDTTGITDVKAIQGDFVGEVIGTKNDLIDGRAEGSIRDVEIDMDQTKKTINSMLDALRLYAEGHAHPDVIFGGNPRYWLCKSNCSHRKTCDFV